MGSIHKYQVNEANNVALGQVGCVFEDGTDSVSG